MNRTRLLLTILLCAMVWTPVLHNTIVNAQDDTGYYDEDSYYDDELYYDEEPVYDDGYYGDDYETVTDWGWSDEHPVEEVDLSWLPHTPYIPLDFSPFTEALDNISPDRMGELESLIVEADVSRLQTLMEAGELTSQELVLFSIDRIMKYDVGQLNSITQINPDALYLAHLRDIQRTNGESKGPLQGIPVLLKENIGTGDSLATTAGSIALAESPAAHDAWVVRQLRDAGAVILGKTNMTEWANWMHLSIANGYSAFGGQTTNPFGGDPSGSSTGNAVAITANFAPLAIGTETMGSIISPSTYASIVGMHPTTGLLSGDNIIPLSPTFDTAGPMGKTVTDIAISMTIFAAEADSSDTRSTNATSVIGADFMTALDPHALEGVRLGVVARDPYASVDEVLASYDNTGSIAALQAAGAEIVVVYPDGLPDLEWSRLITCGMRDGIDTYLEQNGLTDPGSLADIIAINRSDWNRYAPLGQDRLEEAQYCELDSASEAEATTNTIDQARAYLDDMFATYEVDALVTFDDLFALEYGLAGYPAITVPRGGYDESTPSSLTFVGPDCSDVTLVGYAYAFEQTGPYRLIPDLGDTQGATLESDS